MLRDSSAGFRDLLHLREDELDYSGAEQRSVPAIQHWRFMAAQIELTLFEGRPFLFGRGQDGLRGFAAQLCRPATLASE